MTGHERRLLVFGVIEAVANLSLSITIVKLWPHPAAVAIGSLIPNVLLGWFAMWPWAARESGMSAWALLIKTSGVGALAAAAVALTLQASSAIHGQGASPSLPIFFLESIIAAAAGLAVAAPFLHAELKRFRRQPTAPIPEAPATAQIA
jgi:hypothetical protein